MRTYQGYGHAYLVCPALLESDPRHGQHPNTWKPCRRGLPCGFQHKHELELVAETGHDVADFYWPPGGQPPPPKTILCSSCGRALVHADLDDPWAERHLEAEPGPDGHA